MSKDPKTDVSVPYTDEPSDEAGSSHVPYTDEELSERSGELDASTTQDGSRDYPPPFTRKPNRKRYWAILAIVIASAGLAGLIATIVSFSTTHESSLKTPDNKAHKSHKTQAKGNKAVAYRLDFPALYPDVTSAPGSQCRVAWDALTSVPCHDKVFDRHSDNSTGWGMVLRWDPMYFLPRICREDCREALQDAYKTLSTQCSEADMFILEGYSGMFGTQWLEASPAAALETLVGRTDHLCRSAPPGASDYEFCPTEMLERFAVVDGMKTSLEAIDEFVHDTDKRRTEPTRRHTGRKGSKSYSYRYNYVVRTQTYGPGDGETSCGWCTLDFFNRTINSWTEGGIISPDSKKPVSLPEFVRRVTKAGRRCAPTHTWEKMHQDAIDKYTTAGLLLDNWESVLPSGDLEYLIKNGPSLGDSPVSGIEAEIQRLDALATEPDIDETRQTLDKSKSCLSRLRENYISSKCYINLSQDTLSSLIEQGDESKSLRDAYCSDSCSESLDAWSDSWCDSDLVPEAQEFVDDFSAARQQRDTYCNLVGQTSWGWNCAQGLLSMDKTSWAFTGRPDSAILVADLAEALEKVEKQLSPDAGGKGDEEPRNKRKNERERKRNLGNSVCAGCFWSWLVGNDMAQTMKYMRTATSPADYVDFAKRYHTVCTSLGADWLGGVPYGDDPVVWRVKDARGDVSRYIKPAGLDVHAVKEATGRSHSSNEYVNDLWHVLQAERGLKAADEGRFDEWLAEEEEHRREADEAIWKVEDGIFGLRVEYIGPKGGF